MKFVFIFVLTNLLSIVFYQDHHSIIKIAKGCVAAAVTVLDSIRNGREEIVPKKLSALQKDGWFLTDTAEQLAERLEAVDKYFQNTSEKFIREITQLSKRMDMLKIKKSTCTYFGITYPVGTPPALDANQREISNIESQIRSITQQHHQLQRKVDEIRARIITAKKSVQFWLLFRDMLQHCVDRTELVQKIFTRATKKKGYSILQRQIAHRAHRVIMTFIEAWEELETAAKHYELNRILEIEYICSQCGLQLSALPYVVGSKFVCMECHSKFVLKI